jgi:hypothetical protein
MGAIRSLLRNHWAIALVLAAAAAVRVGIAIAYRPALFFGDSWAYLDLAYNGSPVGFAPDRPSGYPLLIDVLSLAGRSLAAITTAQHLAGLAVGLLVYALLARLGLPRLIAAAAAAVVLLDAYAIALEQQIMAESFFALALVASMYLAIGRDRGPGALAASGALLAGAAMIRTAALFALPVWLLYIAWSHGRGRVALAGAAGLLVPLLAYCTLHAAGTGKFGMTQADGWFLYGRVGQFADCGDARVPPTGRALCDRTARDRREGPAFHIWNADGPARRVFGSMSRDADRQERSNRALRQFALAIIRDRPATYAGAVASDFLKYFRPGVMSGGNSDLAVALPESGRLVRRNERIRDRYFPDYEPAVHEPATLARGYQERIHTTRLLLAFLALAALAQLALAAAARGRVHLPRRRESFLLVASALAMLIGTAATSAFVLRYLVPVAPLLVAGGALACADLAGIVRLLPVSSLRVRRARGSPLRASYSR